MRGFSETPYHAIAGAGLGEEAWLQRGGVCLIAMPVRALAQGRSGRGMV